MSESQTAGADARPYVIQPHDTLLTIALMNEVDVSQLRDHPKNAALFEEKGRDPQMLAPGEIVYIPPPEPPTAEVNPKARNCFVATVPVVHLHLHFHSEAGPLGDEPFLLHGPGELLTEPRNDPDAPLEGKLDGAGKLSLKVPALTRSVVLEFPERHIEHELWVGGLDPADRRSGVAARLLHLGFLPLDQELDEPYLFETEEAERATLRTFQEGFLLEPTGLPDGRTVEALTEAHGC